MRFLLASIVTALTALGAAPDALAADGDWYPPPTADTAAGEPVPPPRALPPSPLASQMFSTKMFVAGLVTIGVGGGLLAFGAVNASSNVNAGANTQAEVVGPALYVLGGTVIGTGVTLSVIGAWPTLRPKVDARLVVSPTFTGVVGTF